MPIEEFRPWEVVPAQPATETRNETREIVKRLSEVAGSIAIDGKKPIGEQMRDYNDLMERLLATLEEWAQREER